MPNATTSRSILKEAGKIDCKRARDSINGPERGIPNAAFDVAEERPVNSQCACETDLRPLAFQAQSLHSRSESHQHNASSLLHHGVYVRAELERNGPRGALNSVGGPKPVSRYLTGQPAQG